MTWESHSPEQTQSLAADFARSLRAGQCIALHGDLGAGKTQFVRGLVRGLGGDPRLVSSPTYMLLNVYPTPTFTVFHLDAYRVAGPGDFEGIGFGELLEQGGIVVVEWASRVADLLPREHISIHITATGPKHRQIAL